MKEKKTWISFVVVVLLIGGMATALAGFQPGTEEPVKVRLMDAANPSASPVTYPDGQQYVELNDTYAVGEAFTVWANVTNVAELNLYQVGVTYNDSVLECTDYGEGEFFYRANEEYRTSVVNQPMPADGSGYLGYYNHITWVLKKPGNVSGTGTLAWFDFTVLGWGFTYIDIILSGAMVATLADTTGTDMDFNTIDIIFDNIGLAPAAYGPTADFTIFPPHPRYIDQTLTFTGKNTTSEWGFMGFPNLEFVPIVTMEWDFMYVSDPGVHIDTGQAVTFAYDTEGTYYVNLTVYDARGWNDSVLTAVAILPLAEGAVLDVTTQKAPFNGTGLFMPASPYMANIEEDIVLYAKVLRKNSPVVNKLVTFGVFKVWMEGSPPTLMFSVELIRTAFTDQNGMATVSYRIPTGWENESHGAYVARAHTFIADALVHDMTIYHVEYVNEIKSVVPIPPGSWKPGKTACFNVTIECWDFVALPVVISLILYDDLNASIAKVSCGPVGRPPIDYPLWECNWWTPTRTFFGDGTYVGLMSDLCVPPTTARFVVCAVIPRHAYVGVGTAYVNLHDAWPIDDMYAEPSGLTGDGQAYCPEASAAFGIECP